MSISFFVALIVCLLLLLMLVYGRMQYYRAQVETQSQHIGELQRQVMYLSYQNDSSAAEFTQENF